MTEVVLAVNYQPDVMMEAIRSIEAEVRPIASFLLPVTYHSVWNPMRE